MESRPSRRRESRSRAGAESCRNCILVMIFWEYMSDLWRDHRDACMTEYDGDARARMNAYMEEPGVELNH